MRLTLRWLTAITLPTVMVSAAMTPRSRVHCPASCGRPARKTRPKAANAAALTATAMNAVTAVGAPS